MLCDSHEPYQLPFQTKNITFDTNYCNKDCCILTDNYSILSQYIYIECLNSSNMLYANLCLHLNIQPWNCKWQRNLNPQTRLLKLRLGNESLLLCDERWDYLTIDWDLQRFRGLIGYECMIVWFIYNYIYCICHLSSSRS